MPSKADKVYGIVLNPWFSSDNLAKSLTINGAHIQFCPFAIWTVMYNILATFDTLNIFINKNANIPRRYHPSKDSTYQINGINLVICDWRFSKINGLDINLGASEVNTVNGIAICGLFNTSTNFKGFAISAFSNIINNCKGLEISLINNCHNLKGFQIGLWNINQKRTLPLINWNF